VVEKPHGAVVKFDNTYRNLQRHRAVLPAVARLLRASSPFQWHYTHISTFRPTYQFYGPQLSLYRKFGNNNAERTTSQNK